MERHDKVEASLKTRVRLGIVWMGAAQVVRRLTGLVVTAVLARLLSPSDMGLMALALVATQLMALVSELGLAGALVQRARVDEDDLNTGFWLSLGSASMLAMLGVAASGLISQLFA